MTAARRSKGRKPDQNELVRLAQTFVEFPYARLDVAGLNDLHRATEKALNAFECSDMGVYQATLSALYQERAASERKKKALQKSDRSVHDYID